MRAMKKNHYSKLLLSLLTDDAEQGPGNDINTSSSIDESVEIALRGIHGNRRDFSAKEKEDARLLLLRKMARDDLQQEMQRHHANRRTEQSTESAIPLRVVSSSQPASVAKVPNTPSTQDYARPPRLSRPVVKPIIRPIARPFTLALAAFKPKPIGEIRTRQGTIGFSEGGGTIFAKFKPTSVPTTLVMGEAEFRVERPQDEEAAKAGYFVVPNLDMVLIRHFLRITRRNSKSPVIKWK
jgi:hypothetical protein